MKSRTSRQTFCPARTSVPHGDSAANFVDDSPKRTTEKTADDSGNFSIIKPPSPDLESLDFIGKYSDESIELATFNKIETSNDSLTSALVNHYEDKEEEASQRKESFIPVPVYTRVHNHKDSLNNKDTICTDVILVKIPIKHETVLGSSKDATSILEPNRSIHSSCKKNDTSPYPLPNLCMNSVDADLLSERKTSPFRIRNEETSKSFLNNTKKNKEHKLTNNIQKQRPSTSPDDKNKKKVNKKKWNKPSRIPSPRPSTAPSRKTSKEIKLGGHGGRLIDSSSIKSQRSSMISKCTSIKKSITKKRTKKSSNEADNLSQFSLKLSKDISTVPSLMSPTTTNQEVEIEELKLDSDLGLTNSRAEALFSENENDLMVPLKSCDSNTQVPKHTQKLKEKNDIMQDLLIRLGVVFEDEKLAKIAKEDRKFIMKELFKIMDQNLLDDLVPITEDITGCVCVESSCFSSEDKALKIDAIQEAKVADEIKIENTKEEESNTSQKAKIPTKLSYIFKAKASPKSFKDASCNDGYGRKTKIKSSTNTKSSKKDKPAISCKKSKQTISSRGLLSFRNGISGCMDSKTKSKEKIISQIDSSRLTAKDSVNKSPKARPRISNIAKPSLNSLVDDPLYKPSLSIAPDSSLKTILESTNRRTKSDVKPRFSIGKKSSYCGKFKIRDSKQSLSCDFNSKETTKLAMKKSTENPSDFTLKPKPRIFERRVSFTTKPPELTISEIKDRLQVMKDVTRQSKTIQEKLEAPTKMSRQKHLINKEHYNADHENEKARKRDCCLCKNDNLIHEYGTHSERHSFTSELDRVPDESIQGDNIDMLSNDQVSHGEMDYHPPGMWEVETKTHKIISNKDNVENGFQALLEEMSYVTAEKETLDTSDLINDSTYIDAEKEKVESIIRYMKNSCCAPIVPINVDNQPAHVSDFPEKMFEKSQYMAEKLVNFIKEKKISEAISKVIQNSSDEDSYVSAQKEALSSPGLEQYNIRAEQFNSSHVDKKPQCIKSEASQNESSLDTVSYVSAQKENDNESKRTDIDQLLKDDLQIFLEKTPRNKFLSESKIETPDFLLLTEENKTSTPIKQRTIQDLGSKLMNKECSCGCKVEENESVISNYSPNLHSEKSSFESYISDEKQKVNFMSLLQSPIVENNISIGEDEPEQELSVINSIFSDPETLYEKNKKLKDQVKAIEEIYASFLERRAITKGREDEIHLKEKSNIYAMEKDREQPETSNESYVDAAKDLELKNTNAQFKIPTQNATKTSINEDEYVDAQKEVNLHTRPSNFIPLVLEKTFIKIKNKRSAEVDEPRDSKISSQSDDNQKAIDSTRFTESTIQKYISLESDIQNQTKNQMPNKNVEIPVKTDISQKFVPEFLYEQGQPMGYRQVGTKDVTRPGSRKIEVSAERSNGIYNRSRNRYGSQEKRSNSTPPRLQFALPEQEDERKKFGREREFNRNVNSDSFRKEETEANKYVMTPRENSNNFVNPYKLRYPFKKILGTKKEELISVSPPKFLNTPAEYQVSQWRNIKRVPSFTNKDSPMHSNMTMKNKVFPNLDKYPRSNLENELPSLSRYISPERLTQEENRISWKDKFISENVDLRIKSGNKTKKCAIVSREITPKFDKNVESRIISASNNIKATNESLEPNRDPFHYTGRNGKQLSRKYIQLEEDKALSEFSGESFNPIMSSTPFVSADKLLENSQIEMLKTWLFSEAIPRFLEDCRRYNIKDPAMLEYAKLLKSWLNKVDIKDIFNVMNEQLTPQKKLYLLRTWFKLEGLSLLLDKFEKHQLRDNSLSVTGKSLAFSSNDDYKISLKNWLNSSGVKSMFSCDSEELNK